MPPLQFRVLLATIMVTAGGCVGVDDARNVAARPRPAMPTVRPTERAESPPAVSDDVLDAVLRRVRSGETESALAMIGGYGDSTQRGRLALGVTTALAKEDAMQAAAFAAALPAGVNQAEAFEIAVRAMALRDREEALRWALALPDDVPSRLARQAVANELVAGESRAAIDRITAMPRGAARDDLLLKSAAAWARREPDAAIAWLRERPDDDLRRRLISSVGFAVAHTRPERAVTVAEMLPEGRDRWLLTSAIAQTWVAIDTGAALAWARGLPAGESQAAAYAGFDTGLGMPTSRRIAGAPNTRGGSSRTRGGGAAGWPEMDSVAFAAWLATQRPGMTRDEAIAEYVRQRGASEPAAVGQWLATLPGSPARDRALDIYVENVVTTAPAEAANFLRSLPRSDRTDAMIEKTAQRWLLTNPEAAEAWLRDSTLPPDRKEQLLRQAGR